jgi:hypothetical protein
VRAAGNLEEALATFRTIGPPWAVTSSLADLAAVSREAGDYGGAATLLREACGSVLATGDPAAIADVVHSAAILLGARSCWDGATRLLAAETSLREILGAPQLRSRRPAQERAEAACAAALGEKSFATAWVTGRGMSTEAAVAEARARLTDA